MKTVICIEVEHDRPIPALANLVAGRTWSIDGVKGAEVMQPQRPGGDLGFLHRAGFSSGEIALGMTDVVRG